MDELELIVPDWPAPDRVRAYATTRNGGASEGVFASLNLGYHVGDSRDRVVLNRQRLAEQAKLPSPPSWLEQVHGNRVIDIAGGALTGTADAAISSKPGGVCVIMTADCLPVLICDRDATCVAAIHAGWRGLIDGVIEQTLACLNRPGKSLLAWLGPAISRDAYQVGSELRERFIADDPGNAACFAEDDAEHWRADLASLARRRLENDGVEVFDSGFCTYTDARRFFSYRRDGECGRQASLIWLG